MLYILGITGSIGCGKSTVTRLLGERGARTLDADQLARQLLSPGAPLLTRVGELFGADLLEGDGPPETRALNRARLAERVFADPARRRTLESLLHPQIFREMAATLARWQQTTPTNALTVAALEIPLLFETGSEPLCDTIAVVICGARQTMRLANRVGLSNTTRQAITAQQMPEEEKQKRAHWIIDNRTDATRLALQVDRLWETIHNEKPPQPAAWPNRWPTGIPQTS
ncbi:MAG: dephospho-CoA kinase [Magnetococcales bacterium]|nr:dephospho-CoA kinase [Magnetococcales bacterium]